jgi:LPS-assembly protein
MFRKTISPLWLLLLLLPQLSSAEDLLSEKQSPEISQDLVEIEGENLETLLDRKMKARGNAILKKGNKTIKAEVIEYDEISEKLITQGKTSPLLAQHLIIN